MITSAVNCYSTVVQNELYLFGTQNNWDYSFRQLIAQSREGKIHALQIATESSIRSMQEQSKKLVTGKLKEVAYQKIDDRYASYPGLPAERNRTDTVFDSCFHLH